MLSFYVKFWTDRQKDRQMEWTPVNQYAPSLSMRGHNKALLLKVVIIQACLTLSQTSPCFYVSAVQVFETTVGTGEIACKEQFLHSPQCFLFIWKTSHDFHQIKNCCLQSLSAWKILKFVVWERVNEALEKL